MTTEEYVLEYYEDTPILSEIAHCESRFRHYNDRGTILRGRANRLDVGVMQINEGYHLESAQTLGFDIHTLEGNLSYGQYLYDRYGTQPWSASKPCWRKAEEYLLTKRN